MKNKLDTLFFLQWKNLIFKYTIVKLIYMKKAMQLVLIWEIVLKEVEIVVVFVTEIKKYHRLEKMEMISFLEGLK